MITVGRTTYSWLHAEHTIGMYSLHRVQEHNTFVLEFSFCLRQQYADGFFWGGVAYFNYWVTFFTYFNILQYEVHLQTW